MPVAGSSIATFGSQRDNQRLQIFSDLDPGEMSSIVEHVRSFRKAWGYKLGR